MIDFSLNAFFARLAFVAALSLNAASPSFAQNAPPQDVSPQDVLEADILGPDFSTERLGGDEAARPRGPSLQRALIPAGLLFASFDTDGDYAASRSELNAGVLRSFAAADQNANTVVSLVELASWREAVLGSRDLLPGNTQFDKNFDSQIEMSEFADVLNGLFESFDRNENGQLEFSEMTKNMPQIRRERSRTRDRPVIGRQQGQRRTRGY